MLLENQTEDFMDAIAASAPPPFQSIKMNHSNSYLSSQSTSCGHAATDISPPTAAVGVSFFYPRCLAQRLSKWLCWRPLAAKDDLQFDLKPSLLFVNQ